jgi:hypothetical protein
VDRCFEVKKVYGHCVVTQIALPKPALKEGEKLPIGGIEPISPSMTHSKPYAHVALANRVHRKAHRFWWVDRGGGSPAISYLEIAIENSTRNP